MAEKPHRLFVDAPLVSLSQLPESRRFRSALLRLCHNGSFVSRYLNQRLGTENPLPLIILEVSLLAALPLSLGRRLSRAVTGRRREGRGGMRRRGGRGREDHSREE